MNFWKVAFGNALEDQRIFAGTQQWGVNPLRICQTDGKQYIRRLSICTRNAYKRMKQIRKVAKKQQHEMKEENTTILGTIAANFVQAADVLIENGARRVFAFASHGLLSGPGNDRLANSKMEEIVILNTIPTSPQREANEKLTMLSVAPLLAQAIFNIHAKKSVSALFK